MLTPTILDNQPRLLLVVVCWHELPRAALSVAPVISLSGLNWALLCIFPGEIAEGNGKRQIIIDERADEAQRSALETIISGEACVPLSNHFSVFGSLCAEFVETLFLPIDLEVDLKLRTAKVDIPGVVRSRGRPIINKFNGEPFHIALARDAAPSAPPDDPGNPTVDFHGERRRNDTHQSTTDPEAMLHRKGQGKEAKLAYLGHVLLDNRHGLVADVRVREVTPHVAQKVRWSAIDGRTTRHAGYHVSQRKRKLVEQVFGWMKTVGGLRKLRHRGVPLVDWQLTFAATAYNLVRLRNLEATCP